MALMKEGHFIFDIHISKQELFWKISEDNQSFIAVAESDKFLPRTIDISIKYHHFKAFYKIKLFG